MKLSHYCGFMSAYMMSIDKSLATFDRTRLTRFKQMCVDIVSRLISTYVKKEYGMKEKLEILGREFGVDTVSDWFGKYLLLQSVLNTMTAEDADEFMSDTLMMLGDEIDLIIDESEVA